ncbi:MAG TPA: extracellular solute-binding protein [Acidimicrobiales bacterium]
MRRFRRSRRFLALAVALALVAAACGGDDDDGGTDAAGGDEAGQEAPATPSVQAVYDELEGLEGEARTQRLIELAEAEDADLSYYTSLNVDESAPVIEAFSDAYDIDVDLYRASSSTVLQRVIQEADAGFAGADAILLNGPEMAALDDEGLLQPFESPLTEDIVPEAVFETWAGVYLNLFVAAWNTDRVDEGAAPTSWEDVLTGYDGSLAMELGDFDWFATLVQGYFMDQQGMSEEEAVDVFRQAADGARIVDGHTLMTELLAAGEYDVAASAYHHRVQRLAGEGAPITFEPAVEPIVIRPNGVGIYRDTDAPATALLFCEFMMSDAQELLVEFERTPANTTVQEGGIPEGYELLSADVDELNQQRDKWEELYAEVVAEGDGG